MPRAALLLVFVALLGCAGSDAPLCGGDVTCPADRPYDGTSCLTGLACPYTVTGCVGTGTSRCVEGAWTFEPPPLEGCGIGGFVPPAAETCRAPFAGSAPSEVAVSLPYGGFTWGPQGGAMLAVDLALDGEAAELACVRTSLAVEIDGRAEPEARLALRMRCGESHGIFVVLSENPCEARPYEVTVTATVDGVGSTSTTASLDGGQMGGPPVCP